MKKQKVELPEQRHKLGRQLGHSDEKDEGQIAEVQLELTMRSKDAERQVQTVQKPEKKCSLRRAGRIGEADNLPSGTDLE